MLFIRCVEYRLPGQLSIIYRGVIDQIDGILKTNMAAAVKGVRSISLEISSTLPSQNLKIHDLEYIVLKIERADLILSLCTQVMGIGSSVQLVFV